MTRWGGIWITYLCEAGITEVFAGIASHALDVYGVEHRFVHLDNSSLHVHGKYAIGEEEGEERKMITIYRGFFERLPSRLETGGGEFDNHPGIRHAALAGSIGWEQQ